MTDNPFLQYLETHRDAGPETLKELFRLLAKRTHPDLGAGDATAFVRLQDHYHAALADLIARGSGTAGRDTPATAPGGTASTVADGRSSMGSMPTRGPRSAALTPRDRLMSELYRYKALLPNLELERHPPRPACLDAFARAQEAAASYADRAELALGAFDEQFHLNRELNARYPDVRTKYISLMRALSGFFSFSFMPNDFNRRITRSYLEEVKPVTDVDPTASPAMRSNRSAAARSALYRMRTWLETELEHPEFTLM